MIGNLGVADRTKEDCVKRCQDIEEVLRGHVAVREIVIGTPGEVGPFNLCERVQHALSGGDDFLADTVAGDGCNFQFGHCCLI